MTEVIETQNKKRKSNYEKSKPSVHSNSATLQKLAAFRSRRTSDPTVPRMLCGSVYLSNHSRVSPRPGAVQRDCLGYNHFDCASGRVPRTFCSRQRGKCDAVGPLQL